MSKDEFTHESAHVHEEAALLRESPDELRLRGTRSFGRLLTVEPAWAAKVLESIQSTSYEELECVGLQPDQSALYATIEIKRSSGYGGDLCTGPGNREYVRFFVDWDDDGDFTDADEDLGVASVAVHDITGPKPLHYTVAVTVPDHRRVCFASRSVAVRAVLMYGAIPPAGNPNPPIHWGNVLDTHVQPLTRSLRFVDVVKEAELKLSPQLASLVDVKSEVAVAPAEVEVAQLLQTYGDDVPLHRSLAPHLETVAQALTFDAAPNVNIPVLFEPLLPNVVIEKIDLAGVLGKYVALDGDTSFEQLHCVGLAPDLSAVVGVVTIKRPSGYSGGLCSAGSLENVAFWADWDDNGTFDEYLGTATVRVHDEQIPAGGISYAVFLPVNLSAHQRPCGENHTARIRGVLSWNTPPSTTNPFAVPTWGNAVEALVQLPVGSPVVGQVPFISVVGGMAVIDINGAGYASGTAVMAGFTASNSPFAAEVVIAGHISNPPDLSAGQTALTYGLRYRHESEPVGTAHEITNAFQATLSQYTGSAWTQTHVTQLVDPSTHLYTYREDLTPNGPSGDLTFVEGFVLGKWATSGLPDGRYEVWMTAEIGGSPVDSNHVWVRLDNTAPTGHLASTAGHVFIPQGQPFLGTFDASDAHLGSWSLGVIPGFPNNPSPLSGSTNIAAGTPFSVSTAGATPGGYVLILSVVDRAIVNSGFIGQQINVPLGFCVEEP